MEEEIALAVFLTSTFEGWAFHVASGAELAFSKIT